MNQYIDAQIANMTTMTKTFEQSCKMAAMQDDGNIDRKEEKLLKRISNASAKFIAELERVAKDNRGFIVFPDFIFRY